MLAYDTLAFGALEPWSFILMASHTSVFVEIALLTMAFTFCGCAPAPRATTSTDVPAAPIAPTAANVPPAVTPTAIEVGTSAPRVAAVTPSDRVAPEASANQDAAAQAHATHTSSVAPSPFTTARTGSGAPVLKAAVPTRQTLRTGGSAPVAVYAPPQAIVTFQTRDGGIFPNGQATITVITDDQGLARTIFTANPGTVDQVAVLAGSPGAMGTLSLFLDVTYSPSTDLKAVP